jgi:ATP-binding cassette subfamily B protein
MTLFNDCREFMNVKSHVELIQDFVNSLPSTDTGSQTKKIPNPDNITVRMEHIKYFHDGQEDKPLYEDFNIVIKPHEKIAIMGSIGSGKSTFAKLIARLQTYQGGHIFINDLPLHEIDINDLRDKVIYIPQHPKLFNRTLWENISYGLPDTVTREDIYKFLIEMKMNELEEIFRERMDKPVGKQGSTLSGGQRHMLWLIRAILKKSPFIILDEPTASLDPESKKLVKKMIEIMGKGKTLLLITHDDDLKEGMDRILTFSKGKVISDISGGSSGSSYKTDSTTSENTNTKVLPAMTDDENRRFFLQNYSLLY